jgi:hypothetical protein
MWMQREGANSMPRGVRVCLTPHKNVGKKIESMPDSIASRSGARCFLLRKEINHEKIVRQPVVAGPGVYASTWRLRRREDTNRPREFFLKRHKPERSWKAAELARNVKGVREVRNDIAVK